MGEKIEEPDLLKARLRFIANTSLSASSLRNQGGTGVVKAARTFMGELNLEEASAAVAEGYPAYLDNCTTKLMAYFPEGARKNYGAARKALNIYLFACARDHMARSRYRLDRIELALELPIDRHAIDYLKRQAKDEASQQTLKRFSFINQLNEDIHSAIQAVAAKVAECHGVMRCELDLLAWRNEDEAI